MTHLGHHHQRAMPRPAHSGDENHRDRPPNIAFIIERRHLADRALCDARSTLEDAGCQVEIVAPNPLNVFDVPAEAPSWDAVVSRGRDPAVLSVLAAAAALAVPAVNPPRAIDLVRNKIAMQAVLVRHGMPLPRAWYAVDPAVFSRVPPECFPLVVKPFDGDGSAGLSLLSRPEDAALLPPREGRRSLYVAQQYLEADGWDLKLYGIGSQVWAVRKPAPVLFSGSGPGLVQSTAGAEQIALDANLRDIALTCGRACGLELWGVDVAMTASGPYVIEVNDFPTYSAVPEAGQRIGQHVLAFAQIAALGRRTGHDRMLSLVREAT